jgi:hypothetical protein
VLVSMLDNMQRDPEVNLKTLIGNEEQVLNLRPLDKEKFLLSQESRNTSKVNALKKKRERTE